MLTTVILCGGRGIRLRPLTDRIPKALIPLNGKPCLQHIIESYIRKGYRRFVLCVGYQGEMIVDFFRRQTFDAEIEFSDAGEQASMLERIYQARSFIGERAFVAYGDTLIDVDLAKMLAYHITSGAAVTLTTAGVRSPFGLVKATKDGWVVSFEEKPVQPYYIGHMLTERAVLDEVDPELLRMPDGGGLVTLFQRLIEKRRLRLYPYTGPQITFNTQQDLVQAERDLLTFFTHQERESR
ncbi:MAG: NDP-sugar synthase [Candidatus Methylomirabilales bacterium]